MGAPARRVQPEASGVTALARASERSRTFGASVVEGRPGAHIIETDVGAHPLRTDLLMARRSYGSGRLFAQTDTRGRESWYGMWWAGGRRVKRKLVP